MNHLLARLGIIQNYSPNRDTILFVDVDGVVWEQLKVYQQYRPLSVPPGTTPVALASGELIGWSRYQVAKYDRFISVISMLPLPTTISPGSIIRFEETNVIQLPIRRDRAGNPTLIAPSRAAVTDARDIVLFRDPPALKTSIMIYGKGVWFELPTETFYSEWPDGKRYDIPRDVIKHYLIGAQHGQHRNSPAPLHGGAAQISGYGSGRSSASLTATQVAAAQQAGAHYAQQAGAGAGLKAYRYLGGFDYIVDPPKLPRADPVVGEVVAWRAWTIFDKEPAILLTSIYMTAAVWKPGEPLISKPPTDYGDIGIHAHKTRETLLKYVGEQYSTKLLVIGRVRLWGEVVEGETGYRAEFAQVESLEEILRPKFASWSEVDWEGNPRHMSPAEEAINNAQLLAKLREVYGVN